MHPFPETPSLPDDPSLSGHLWIQELVTGLPVRFCVEPSGLITFGDERSSFDGDVPLPYRTAADNVRDRLSLDAIREATDQPDSVTFYGTATVYKGVEYDWSELPGFLGVDVWSATKGSFLPPDASSRAYDSLGLSSLPAVEKEAPADYTDIGGYAGDLPASEWTDGPSAGVLFRDKSGGRYEAWREIEEPEIFTVEEAVEAYANDARIDSAVEGLQKAGDAPTVDGVLGRVLSRMAREGYARLYEDGELVVPERELRSAVAERVRRRL